MPYFSLFLTTSLTCRHALKQSGKKFASSSSWFPPKLESKCGTCDSVYKLSKEVLKLIIVTLTAAVKKGMQGSLWRQLEERAGGLAPSQLMPVGRTYPERALLGPTTTTTTTTWALPVQTSPVPAQGRQSPPSEPAGRALRLLPIPISSFFASSCPVLSLGVLRVVGCCVVNAEGGVTRPTECWCKKTHADRSLMDAE